MFVVLLFLLMFPVSTESANKEGIPRFSFEKEIYYTDNINYADSGSKKSDFALKLLPSLLVKKTEKAMSYKINVGLGYELFFNNSPYNNLFGYGTAELKSEVSKKMKLQILDNYTRTYEPRSVKSLLSATVGRFRYDLNDLFISLKNNLNEKYSLEFSYSNNLTFISSSAFEDSAANKIYGRFTNYLRENYNFFIVTGYRNRYFHEGDYYYNNIIFAGIEFSSVKNRHVAIETGYNYLHGFCGETYDKPYFKLSVSYKRGKNSIWSISCIKDTGASAYDKSLYDYYGIRFLGNKNISRRIYSRVTFYYEHGRYEEISKKSRIYNLTTELTYDLTDDVIAFGRYSLESLEASLDADYVKNTLLLGIRKVF
ncbi:MAG: hypothetical protein DRP84_09980 [Spirochaetes bacterium]|nr:MAG: hypothetical protein DRP84_09980 [Spirochaetota bacterium]